MIIEEIELIKQYFQILNTNHPEKFEIEEMFDDDGNPIIPQNMKDNNNFSKWILLESNVSEEDIIKLETQFNIKLPSIYKAFLSSYYHIFEELDGVFDDFYDEYDREIFVNIIPQSSDKPLSEIQEVFEECRARIDLGYIPIGEFNGWGPLCFDTLNSDKLVWLDHEEYYNCEKREELEKLAVPIFNDFKEFMECFFSGITHKCGI